MSRSPLPMASSLPLGLIPRAPRSRLHADHDMRTPSTDTAASPNARRACKPDGMRRWGWLLGLLSPALFAEVVPDWSVDLSSNVLAPSALPIQSLGMLGPVAGLFLSQYNGGQFVSSLVLDASGTERDQFAVSSTLPVVGNVQMLDSNATGALLRFYVSPFNQPLHRVDATGRRVWVLDRRADDARLLDDGDVLVLDEHLLLRLAADDGRVRWAYNLLDAPDLASDGAFRLGDVVDGQIDVIARYLAEPSTYSERIKSAWLLSIDAANGELRWAVNTATGAEHRWRPRCAPQVWGADRIDMRMEGAPVVEAAVIDRRDRSTGALRWSQRLPLSYEDGGSCALLAHGGRVYLSADSGAAPGQMHALDIDHGTVLWQQQLTAGRLGELHPAPGGDLLVIEADTTQANITRHLLTRRHATDGAMSWSVEIPAAQVALDGSDNAIAVAWAALIGSSPQAHFDRYDPGTGALLSTVQSDVQGFQGQPVAAAAIHSQACGAKAIDSQPAYVDAQCRDAAAGTLVWSRSLPPIAEGERINLLQLLALGSDRLLARVSTRLPIVGGDLLRDHLHVLDVADGTTIWQHVRIGTTNLVAGADGDIYVRDLECAKPPSCLGASLVVRALDGLTGAARWTRATDVTPLAAGAGVMIGWHQSTLGGFQALAAASGADIWFYESGATSGTPGALTTRAGEVLIKYELPAGAQREVRTLRLDPTQGTLIYSIQPSVAAPRTDMSRLQESADGHLLVSASRGNDSWLARVRSDDGQSLWQSYPMGSTSEGLLARFEGPLPSADWVHVTRTRSILGRRALARLQADGTWSAEHLYLSEPTLPGESPGSVQMLDIRADGAALAFDRRRGPQGLRVARLHGWPAPASVQGDVRIDVTGIEAGTGMAPSTGIELQISNDSSHQLDNLWVHADSAQSQLWFRMLNCVPAQACASFSSDGATLSLPANAAALLRVEVIDPGYRPGTSWSEDNAVFRVDPPFDFGDVELNNNLATTPVRLGGMGSGFE